MARTGHNGEPVNSRYRNEFDLIVILYGLKPFHKYNEFTWFENNPPAKSLSGK